MKCVIVACAAMSSDTHRKLAHSSLLHSFQNLLTETRAHGNLYREHDVHLSHTRDLVEVHDSAMYSPSGHASHLMVEGEDEDEGEEGEEDEEEGDGGGDGGGGGGGGGRGGMPMLPPWPPPHRRCFPASALPRLLLSAPAQTGGKNATHNATHTRALFRRKSRGAQDSSRHLALHDKLILETRSCAFPSAPDRSCRCLSRLPSYVPRVGLEC